MEWVLQLLPYLMTFLGGTLATELVKGFFGAKKDQRSILEADVGYLKETVVQLREDINVLRKNERENEKTISNLTVILYEVKTYTRILASFIHGLGIALPDDVQKALERVNELD